MKKVKKSSFSPDTSVHCRLHIRLLASLIKFKDYWTLINFEINNKYNQINFSLNLSNVYLIFNQFKPSNNNLKEENIFARRFIHFTKIYVQALLFKPYTKVVYQSAYWLIAAFINISEVYYLDCLKLDGEIHLFCFGRKRAFVQVIKEWMVHCVLGREPLHRVIDQHFLENKF